MKAVSQTNLDRPDSLNRTEPSLQTSPSVQQSDFPQSIDVLNQPALTRHSLVDIPSDLSPSQAIGHLLGLRNRKHAGSDIERTDLYTNAKTTVGNKTQLHLDREYFTQGLIPAIATAEDSIHLAMLTLNGGELGEYVVDLLLRKKQENPNIAIRILVDDFGSNALFPWSDGRENLNRLKDAGIEVELNRFAFEGLEHRKLLVVDGKKAFIGGSCFGDEYFGNEAYWNAYHEAAKAPGFDPATVFYPASTPESPLPFEVTPEMDLPEYHDFGIQFEGPAVQSLQASFLQSWLVQENNLEPETNQVDFVRRYFPRPNIDGENSLPVKLSHAVPKGDSEYRQSILDIVDTAQDTLDINFSYILIPEFIERVRKAAERGVKIRILVPGVEGTDKESTWSAFRSYYPDLLKTGNVEMFEFKTYTHCKFIVADSRLVFTSTGNPEYNSWEGGWDETALIDSPQFAAEIERRVFDVDFAPDRAEKIGLTEVATMSLWGKIKQFFYLLFIRLFQSPTEPYRTRKKMIRRSSRSAPSQNRRHNPLQLNNFSMLPPKPSIPKNSVSPLTEEGSRFER